MPTTFPTAVPFRMPVARTLTRPTRVIEFLDGTEQRWISGSPLNAFELVFNDVPAADLTAMRTFVATVKGAFDTTWSFTSVDGVSYPNMALEQDGLPVVAGAKPLRYSFSVKMRQVAVSGASYATAAAVYPALANGCYTQRPFTQDSRFKTVRNDLASGARYSRYEWGTPKGAWVAEYPVLTLAELQTRLDFFIAMRGRYTKFSFHDPVANADFANCRFDADQFVARAMGAGVWSTSLPICEFKV